MSYLIAIDVGIRNMGVCIYDFLTNRIIYWNSVNLVERSYFPRQNVDYVIKFVQRHKEYFDNAFKVVIERQMRCNMRIIEAILHALFHDKCEVISPRHVKVHYQLSHNNYTLNKNAAKEWAASFVENNESIFTSTALQCYQKANKLDDYADALLLIMYYLDTYSTHNGSD